MPAPPALLVTPDFYDDPGFLDAVAAQAVGQVEGADHVLFSYHGLPERHVKATDHTGAHCLASGSCCDAMGVANVACYRAQCFATTRGLVQRLGLDDGSWSVSFQSRLGRAPWIKPYTDHVLVELAESGVKHLAVLTPSFVADCLETVEEIGIRADEDFRAAGGETLTRVPCVNSAPDWVAAVAAMARRAAG
jgi:ferrochelatase